MGKGNSSLKKRLNMLLLVCLAPLAALIINLLVMLHQFSGRYDVIVENITIANAYNINFKEDMDYLMYIIVVNSERAEELVDTEQPHIMIEEAREAFQKLYELADSNYPKIRLQRILKSLDTLEKRIEEIEADALVSGNYDKNMERLDLNVRILTELIQEQIQNYIYFEARNLETIREGIRSDVDAAIRTASIMFAAILIGALLISRRITTGITEPIRKLCEVTKLAGSGDFAVRTQDKSMDELTVLNASFNQMVGKIGKLVEDIRVEQLNLRATELKLLQAQINPHFLYNTLDTIIWLAEAGQKEQVVQMVSALSDFFRTTLSKGRDFITVKEEQTHISSYLQIQQVRYRDILTYEIDIPEELFQYEILKLTLQPLVENALYHGIKCRRGMGRIRVSGAKEEDKLIFRVWDDGMGMDNERLAHVRSMIRGEQSHQDDTPDTSGFGLNNVAQRISLNYGKGYGLTMESVYGEWTEAKVVIPAVKK